jgi:hypothetical protein
LVRTPTDKKNYKLMPLAELEKSIAKNKHLPNIPSAAEIEKNGIPLSVGVLTNRNLYHKR